VTVQSTVNNGGAITAPTAICAGASASITNVTAATTGTPASTGPTYYYYWERTTAPAVGWTLYETTSNLTSALPTAVTGTAGTYNLVRNSAFGCAGQVNSNVLTFTVNGAPGAPISVTASPSTITQGSSTNLNATSAGNTINWYTTPTGATLIGSSASGANFAVTPATTTTYYAESNVGTAGSQTFSYSGSIVNWNVPAGVTSIDIEAWGAQGGASGGNAGGLGARMKGTFAVTPGQALKVLVGGQGGAGTQGGGGGGSFVTTSANAAMCIAGGGGGGHYDVYSSGSGQSAGTVNTTGQNGMSGNSGAQCGAGGAGPNGGGVCATNGVNTGAGGGGLTSNGSQNGTATGGRSFTNGGAGGSGAGSGGAGGFGGGGGGDWLSWTGGGGGGGYGGGGGGNYYGVGGGGGSFNGGSNQSNSSGVRAGNGQVVISWSVSGCSSATRVPVTVTVNPCAYTPGSQTFNYTGGAQTWTVPCGVSSVTVDAYGAQGGDNAALGGRGGRLQASVPVSPGQTLNIYVGGAGTSCNTGGYNGGGATSCTYTQSRVGGGASDVRIGGTDLANRAVVAAGGGGAGYNWGSSPCDNGGNAGGLIGSANPPCVTGCSGGGGSQTFGGAAGTYSGWSSGVAGSVGQGGSGGAGTGGGGGGGGYFGGGGGSWCGGGGGSSYSSGTILTNSPGVRTGNGQVTISW